MTEQTYRNWNLRTDEKGIVWLDLDVPDTGTNTLGSTVMTELAAVLDQLESTPPRALVIWSRKDSGFAAGADVKEFTRIRTPSQAYELVREGQRVLDRIQALPCPTVAMLHGFALGGGLELAMACRYRMAADTPATRLGLPEVRLGIHPGFGGTMRSVLLMGVLPAMDLLLSGRSLSARQALSRGLVDKIGSPAEMREKATNLALAPPARHRPPLLQRLLCTAPVRPLLAAQLRRRVAQRARPDHYPAPYAIIRLWQRTGGAPRQTTLEAEAHSIADLLCSDTARNLIRVFMLQNRLKALGRESKFTPKHVHVVGAGTMGGDIASWCAARGMEVTVQDREAGYVEAALERARAFFEHRFHHDEARIGTADGRLKMDLAGEGIPDADLVIEAIFEDPAAKVALFREIEPRLSEQAVLATNTSSIPLENLAETLQAPERLVGLHFFNPVAKMPLVEVVSGRRTSPEVQARALSAVRALGKLPVPVRSAPGFLVNRILAPYLAAALTAWEAGESLVAVDRAAEDFGMPMGPAELADTVGLDVAVSVAEVLRDQLPVAMPARVLQLVEAGHLGRKTGRGLYEWHGGKARKSGNTRSSKPRLQERLILPLLNEAVRCLREGIVEDGDLLDAGVVFGTGFAPFRGGPLHYARQFGPSALKEALASLVPEYGALYDPDPGWDRL